MANLTTNNNNTFITAQDATSSEEESDDEVIIQPRRSSGFRVASQANPQAAKAAVLGQIQGLAQQQQGDVIKL